MGSVYFSVFLILIIGQIDAENKKDDIQEKTSVTLVPTPHKIPNEYYDRLTSLNWKQRAELCVEKISQMEEPVFNQILLTTQNIVGEAHAYNFNGTEELIAIRCATVPAMYIGLPKLGKIPREQWYIRTIKPPLKDRNFTLEIALSIKEVSDSFDKWTSQTHIFYKLEKIEYWYLCKEAKKMTQHKLLWLVKSLPTVPTFHEYNFGAQIEKYLTILCPTEPPMFIHAGKQGSGTEFVIVFRKFNVSSSDEI